MKTIAMTICGTILTSAIALAQTTTAPATGTPQVPNATQVPTTGNQVNSNLNRNNGTTNAVAPLNQSPQTLQGMPQSQLAPSTTPAQPSPYQTTPQAPATQTQPSGQSTTFQTPTSTQPGQTLTPNAPAGVQSPATSPQSNPGNVNQPGQQALPPASTYPSLNPSNTQQQPNQQNGNQPRQNQ